MNLFRKLCGRVFPSCSEAARLASRSMDEKLSRPCRFGLWLHHKMCRLCRCYANQVKFVRDAAGCCEEKSPLPEKKDCLSKSAKDRLKRELRSAAEEEK